MTKKILLPFLILIIGILCAVIQSTGATDNEPMHHVIDQTYKNEWQKAITDGIYWPESLFPISTWNETDRKQLPREYFNRLLSAEKGWPEMIRRRQQGFRKEYGGLYDNLYDLFLGEQKKVDGKMLSPLIAKQKTTARLIDLACLSAENLQKMNGIPFDKIRVLALKNDVLQAIPFDIVEFTQDRRAVLPMGPEANPGDGDGKFNHHDRIFFMVVDAGHKIQTEKIHGLFKGIDQVMEVEMTDLKGAEVGWVYVASFSGAIPDKSPLKYIGYDEKSNMMNSDFLMGAPEFKIVNGEIRPTLKARSWIVGPAAGGMPVDLYDSMFFGYTIKLQSFVTIDETVDDVDTSWRAWFCGNVINFHRSTWEIKTPFRISAPTVIVDLLSSAFFANATISVSTPIDPSMLIKSVDLSLGDKLVPDIRQYGDILKIRYLNANNRTGFELTGRNGVKAESRESEGVSWHMLTSQAGSILCRTFYDEFMDKQSKSTLFVDGERGETAYFSKIHTDHLTVQNFQLCLEWDVVPFFWNESPADYDWKKLDLILKRVDKPLRYRIDGGNAVAASRFFHSPDVQKEKAAYRY